jgi:TRAP-type uncharacterized transport system substrate-binding protein
MKNPLHSLRLAWRRTALAEILQRRPGLRVLIYVLLALTTGLILYGLLYTAPVNSITMTTGPAGSQYQRDAAQYAAILKRSGVKLRILSSKGSLDNIGLLNNKSVHVDVGFVQGGVPDGIPLEHLESLGSVRYQPLMIFYRSAQPYTLLSQFSRKVLVIGPEGSGAHLLALKLLKLNGIESGTDTPLLDTDSDEAAAALLDGRVDAVFFMGDSANMQVTHKLLHADNIRLFSFEQADAYTRKAVFLSKLVMPRGALDLGKDIPGQNITLVGPTVELVAREGFNPALSDLLLEAAKEVHGKPSMLQNRGEFPAPLQHEFTISDSATRYYKSGKTFLYRFMPFQLASYVDRLLVVVVPLVVLLIPGLRIIPALYNWRMRARILRWYGALLVLERDVGLQNRPDKHEDLVRRLNHIELAVNRLRVPVSFADQFYVLRQHIDFVRDKLKAWPEKGPMARG